jgi:hypothetical protein
MNDPKQSTTELTEYSVRNSSRVTVCGRLKPVDLYYEPSGLVGRAAMLAYLKISRDGRISNV